MCVPDAAQCVPDAAQLLLEAEARKTKELNLSFQGFRFFPIEAMYIDSLKTLFVNDNQIRTVPKSAAALMTSVTELNLGNNEISSLPFTVGEMTALTKLTLSGNTLKNLPPTMGRIEGLKELSVTNNLLEAPPRDVVERGEVTALSTLDRYIVSRRPVHARANHAAHPVTRTEATTARSFDKPFDQEDYQRARYQEARCQTSFHTHYQCDRKEKRHAK